MNKKSMRNTLHAPTTQPGGAIGPSGAIALDGELPHSASTGVAAPTPLAAHDVLHAAMAQPDTSSVTHAADGGYGTEAVNDPGAAANMETMADTAHVADTNSIEPGKGTTKKSAKKISKTTRAAVPADPLDAAVAPKVKQPREKFVACSFTLSHSEAALLNAMKKTHQDNGVKVKKSQLLRAALLHLAAVDSEELAQLVAQLPEAPVKRKKK